MRLKAFFRQRLTLEAEFRREGGVSIGSSAPVGDSREPRDSLEEPREKEPLLSARGVGAQRCVGERRGGDLLVGDRLTGDWHVGERLEGERAGLLFEVGLRLEGLLLAGLRDIGLLPVGLRHVGLLLPGLLRVGLLLRPRVNDRILARKLAQLGASGSSSGVRRASPGSS